MIWKYSHASRSGRALIERFFAPCSNIHLNDYSRSEQPRQLTTSLAQVNSSCGWSSLGVSAACFEAHNIVSHSCRFELPSVVENKNRNLTYLHQFRPGRMGVAVSKYFRPSVELANTIQPPATDQQTQQETPRETLSKLADSKQATVHRESNVSSQHLAPDFAPVDDRSSTPLEQSQQSYLVTAFACAPSRAKISGLVKRLIDQYADAVDVPELVFKAEERHLRPKAPASNRSTLLLVSPSIESDNSATAPVQSIPTSTGSPVLFKPRTATSTVSTTSIASVIIQEDSPLTPRFKQPILNASLVPFNTSLPVLAEHHDELQAHRESFTPKPAVPLVSPSTLPESLAVPPGLTTHKDRLNTQLTRNLTPISPVPRWIHPCIHASSPPSPDLTALSFVILAKERDNCAAIPSAQEVPYGSLVKIPTPEKLVISPPAKLRENIAARGITTPTTVQLILLHCTMRSMSAVVFAANGEFSPDADCISC